MDWIGGDCAGVCREGWKEEGEGRKGKIGLDLVGSLEIEKEVGKGWRG